MHVDATKENAVNFMIDFVPVVVYIINEWMGQSEC
jgi:hypothetical protein